MHRARARRINSASVAGKAGAAGLAASLVTLMVVLLLALSPAGAQAVSYSNQEVELVRLLNEYRQGLGLQPLMVSDLCSDAAEKHSADMGKYSFFAHKSLQSDFFPIGADARVRMSTCGYPYSIAWGETIAGGYSTAAGVIQAWRGSPTHDRVMTDPAYRVIGIGVVYVPDSPYRYYWTADFGAFVDSTAHWVGTDPSSTTTSTVPPSTTTTTTTVPPSTTTTTSPPPTTTSTTLVGVAFADVTPTHSFYKEITSLASAGVVSGYGDGLFHPNDPVTRAQFAKIIVLALGKHTTAIDNLATPTFRDVRYTGSDYPFDYVEEAVGLGIIQGYGDSTFAPRVRVTRAQLALMLARAGGTGLRSPPAGYACPFTDVPAYAREAVGVAFYNGLVSGKTAIIYDPYGQATRGQVAKMIYGLRQVLGL